MSNTRIKDKRSSDRITNRAFGQPSFHHNLIRPKPHIPFTYPSDLFRIPSPVVCPLLQVPSHSQLLRRPLRSMCNVGDFKKPSRALGTGSSQRNMQRSWSQSGYPCLGVRLDQIWKRSLSGFPNIFENESKICSVRVDILGWTNQLVGKPCC